MFFLTPPHHGTLRRYHAHPEAWLHKISDIITFEEGPLLEPLTVALAGVERSGLRLADPPVTCGAGPIGLGTLLAANATGAEFVVITDLGENRFAKVKQLVPRVRPVKVQKQGSPQELGQRLVRELDQEAKLVLECTGVESSVHAGIYMSFFQCPGELPGLMCSMPGNTLWTHRLRHWRRQGTPEYPFMHISAK